MPVNIKSLPHNRIAVVVSKLYCCIQSIRDKVHCIVVFMKDASDTFRFPSEFLEQLVGPLSRVVDPHFPVITV
jgi:hypothetical protein